MKHLWKHYLSLGRGFYQNLQSGFVEDTHPVILKNVFEKRANKQTFFTGC